MLQTMYVSAVLLMGFLRKKEQVAFICTDDCMHIDIYATRGGFGGGKGGVGFLREISGFDFFLAFLMLL